VNNLYFSFKNGPAARALLALPEHKLRAFFVFFNRKTVSNFISAPWLFAILKPKNRKKKQARNTNSGGGRPQSSRAQ
jgi:hypothetical protein